MTSVPVRGPANVGLRSRTTSERWIAPACRDRLMPSLQFSSAELPAYACFDNRDRSPCIEAASTVPRVPSEQVTLTGIGSKPRQRARQRIGLTGWNEDPISSVRNCVANSTNSGSDDRQLERHCLHHRNRQAFVIRAQAKEVERAHHRVHVRSVPEESEPVTESEPAVQRLQLSFERTLSNREEHHVRVLRRHPGRHFQQEWVVLLPPQVRHGTHDDRVVIQPEFRSHCRTVVALCAATSSTSMPWISVCTLGRRRDHTVERQSSETA